MTSALSRWCRVSICALQQVKLYITHCTSKKQVLSFRWTRETLAVEKGLRKGLILQENPLGRGGSQVSAGVHKITVDTHAQTSCRSIHLSLSFCFFLPCICTHIHKTCARKTHNRDPHKNSAALLSHWCPHGLPPYINTPLFFQH